MDQNPIIVLDDDQDDLELMCEAARTVQLEREIICLKSGDELVAYLNSCEAPPFLVLCDVNLPRESGFEVRNRVIDDPELRYKSVPFVFWSTSSSEAQIQQAYESISQGFFIKPTTFDEICTMLKAIELYWSMSRHPKAVG